MPERLTMVRGLGLQPCDISLTSGRGRGLEIEFSHVPVIDQVERSYFKFKYNLAIATWCRIFPPLDSKNPIRQVAVI